jgi:site-specific recombinase XerD
MRGVPTLDAFELYRLWWADVPTRLGTATVKQYRREVFAACADLGRHPLDVKVGDIDRHLGELRPQHASLRRAALADFFGWMERRGHRPDNPLKEARKAKVGRQKVKRGWTEEELFRVFQAAIWIGHYGRRGTGVDVAWAILAQYGLCLRPGEICRLAKSQISLNGRSSCVYITDTKTGNDRIVPVVGPARVALEALLELSPATSAYIINVGTTRYWELVSAAARLAGLAPEKCRPYALRHTGATHLAERGVHPRLIAEILGHVDLRHVHIYTQPTDAALREALGKLGE